MNNIFLVILLTSLVTGNLLADIGDGEESVSQKSNKGEEGLPINISAQFEANQGNNQYDTTYGVGLGLDKKIKSFGSWNLIGNVDAILKKVNTNGETVNRGSVGIDTEAGLTLEKDNVYVAGKVGVSAFSTEDTYANNEARYYGKLETGYRTKSGSSIGVGAIMNMNDHSKNNPNRIVDGIYIKTTYGF